MPGISFNCINISHKATYDYPHNTIHPVSEHGQTLNNELELTKTKDGLHSLHLQQSSHGAGEAPLPQPQDAPT